MTLKIDMFIGPKMVDVRGQTDPQKTLPKGSRKGGPKGGGVIEFPPEVFFSAHLSSETATFSSKQCSRPPPLGPIWATPAWISNIFKNPKMEVSSRRSARFHNSISIFDYFPRASLSDPYRRKCVFPGRALERPREPPDPPGARFPR